MLKNIPSIVGPELLKILSEMGHSDEIVIADGNFPACSLNSNVIRLDGHNCPEVLEAVLKLLPLDPYEQNAFLMQVVPGDNVATPIWETYEKIATIGDSNFKGFDQIERFAFYERTKKAYAVITTSEKALYANIILKKGVI
ncbi:MAG: RbsD/FucU domain-containing protein [Sphaerochaetaceae bacterium]|nr:RbsD/FucU domain-containing protein [Sphaerochaetaceae bacterium]